MNLTDIDIEAIIGNKGLYFMNRSIKEGNVCLRKNNSHWRIPGGLCSVYKYTLQDGSVKALRIWKTLISESKERSNAIAKHLKSLQSPYFVDFEYIKDAFTYNHVSFPIVLMEWCDGVDMKTYIDVNINNGQKIKELADNFFKMVKYFHEVGISHGDLHHENIMVKSNGSIVVIDYDSMFVPNLKGYRDECGGYDGYQHPARAKNEYLCVKLDYFSELILYTSISAIAQNTSLFSKYSVKEQDKSMLFTAFDFSKLRNSTIYHDIKNLGNNFQILLNILESYLSKTNINDLEPFYIVAQRMGLQIPANENMIIPGQKKNDTILVEPAKFVARYCNQCGREFYKQTSKYCSNCGKKRK